MEKKYTEKFNVSYSCGCVHELGQLKGAGFQSTGVENNCAEHK